MANTVAAMKSQASCGNRYLMWAEACITCLQTLIHTAKKFQFTLLQTLFDDGDKVSYHRFLRITQTLWNSIDELKPQTWNKGWRRSAFMISLHSDKWNHFHIKRNLTNRIPPVSVSHDASQRSCDFAQDIFSKAASSHAPRLPMPCNRENMYVYAMCSPAPHAMRRFQKVFEAGPEGCMTSARWQRESCVTCSKTSAIAAVQQFP